MVSDLALRFGLQPTAVVGYSLGESTGLFALRAWTERDEMLRRVSSSTLFTKDLTGTSEALRRAWGLSGNQPAQWQAGLVDRPAAQVDAAMAPGERIYVLIVNTPGECVIGGEASAVKALVDRLGCHWFPLGGVSTVHCELLQTGGAGLPRIAPVSYLGARRHSLFQRGLGTLLSSGARDGGGSDRGPSQRPP